MTATATATVGSWVTAPGIYDLPEDVYHADPIAEGSLSHTGARRILECPARFAYWRSRELHKREFDFGKAAHRLVLGAGADVVVVEADSWRTNAAKAQRDEAYAAGQIPVLAEDWAVASTMAAALRDHPIAARLFSDGTPEQSMFWRTGDVWRRARPDWLPNTAATGRTIFSDYKTTLRADTPALARSIANFGYHQQADWYIDGYETLTGAVDTAFVFVFQEKEPPFLVNVVELDTEALAIGRARNRRALDIYRACTSTGVWPGYPAEVQQVALPRWAQLQEDHDQQQEEGEPW